MSSKKTIAIVVIVCIIILLYLSFLSIDFKIINLSSSIDNDKLNDILKYLSILLCFILSLSIGNDKISTHDRRFLQLGLFFTSIADLCLVILDRPTPGIILFCIVQMCYIIRFNLSNNRYYLGNLLMLLILLIILKLIVKSIGFNIRPIFIIALFYATCIFTSTFTAMISIKNYQFPNNLFIIAGMLLFVLCDTNVALYNVSLEIYTYNLKGITNICGSLIWFFYLPSQLFLSFSGFKYKSWNVLYSIYISSVFFLREDASNIIQWQLIPYSYWIYNFRNILICTFKTSTKT